MPLWQTWLKGDFACAQVAELMLIIGSVKSSQLPHGWNENGGSNLKWKLLVTMFPKHFIAFLWHMLNALFFFHLSFFLAAWIQDSIGLHRVENVSHTECAVSLHLYSPPFQSCQTFDQRTGHKNTVKMTFWSKFGERTPYVRNPLACEHTYSAVVSCVYFFFSALEGKKTLHYITSHLVHWYLGAIIFFQESYWKVKPGCWSFDVSFS